MPGEKGCLSQVGLSNVHNIALAIITFSVMVTTYLSEVFKQKMCSRLSLLLTSAL